MNQPRPSAREVREPRRGSTNDEMSAKTMKAPATVASPIFWPVVKPATTSVVESIGAGTYRN